MTPGSTPDAEHPARPSVAATLLMLVAIAVVTGAYIGLNLVAGSHEVYVGFMFLLYWTGPRKASLAELPAVAAGSLVGLGLGFALQQLQLQMGAQGALVFLAIILVAVFLLIRQQLRFLINEAAMLMLTLATVAHVQAHASFPGMFISLGLAIVFFGLVFWAIARVTEARGRRASPEPVSQAA